MLSRSWIEAEVIQSQHIVRPTAAADTLDRDQFALEILRSFELRARHEIAFGALEQRADDHDVQASGGEIQHGVGAGQNRIHITGYQGRSSERSNAHVDDFDVEAVLTVKPLLDADPEHGGIFAARAVGDAECRCCLRRGRVRANQGAKHRDCEQPKTKGVK